MRDNRPEDLTPLKRRHGGAARLRGQVVLVTGGGRGIGRAIALALANAKAKVAVCARSTDQTAETVRMIEERGGQALAISADVSDRVAVEKMVSQTERELGCITLLVNNAAVPGPVGLVAESDPDQWWRTLEINVRGPLYCSHAVLLGIRARGAGRIINVCSGWALVPVPFVSAYAVSKAALQRLTENLAAETAEWGIKVFALDPGLVHTEMAEWGMHCGVPEVEQYFQKHIVQGEHSPPERAARLAVSIASGWADRLSGRFLHADDDFQAVVQRAAEIQEQDLYVLRGRM